MERSDESSQVESELNIPTWICFHLSIENASDLDHIYYIQLASHLGIFFRRHNLFQREILVSTVSS